MINNTCNCADNVTVSHGEFDNIVGYDDIKAELIRTSDVVKNPDKYMKLGVEVPAGILLHGIPGVGKTTMAMSFIDSLDRNVYICKKILPSDEMVEEIKKVFDTARDNTPSVVLVDDIDKFESSDEQSALQACIDSKNRDVFVIATANDLDNLPKSLLRVGRFDKSIEVSVPSRKDAEKIIKHYLSDKETIGEIDTEELAVILSGYSCVELEKVVNEAGIYAGFADKGIIEMEDIVRACLRLIYEIPEATTRDRSRKIVCAAYHEAGHAIVSEITRPDSVVLVSIMSKNKIWEEGFTLYDFEETVANWAEDLRDGIATGLGGRAAVEVKYGRIGIGDEHDIKEAFKKAEKLVTKHCIYGFGGRELAFRQDPDSSNVLADIQIKAEVETQYQRAKHIITENMDMLEELAQLLLERGTLTRKDIKAIKTKLSKSYDIKIACGM